VNAPENETFYLSYTAKYAKLRSLAIKQTKRKEIHNMKPKDIEFIKANLKWSFTWSDFLSRYFIIIGPFGIALVGCTMFNAGFRFGYISANNYMNSYFYSALTGLLLGMTLIYYIIRRIESEKKFEILILPKNTTFDDIPKKIRISKWTIVSKTKEVIEISTNISLFSWGELITIIKLDDKSILVNSRPSGRQPFTINRDKVNLKKLDIILETK